MVDIGVEKSVVTGAEVEVKSVVIRVVAILGVEDNLVVDLRVVKSVVTGTGVEVERVVSRVVKMLGVVDCLVVEGVTVEAERVDVRRVVGSFVVGITVEVNVEKIVGDVESLVVGTVCFVVIMLVNTESVEVVVV